MPQRDLPAISGIQLIKLLRRDGWELIGDSRHGAALVKRNPQTGEAIRATIPKRRKSLPKTVLHRILSKKQTGIGRRGLQRLIEKHGQA